MSEWFGGFVGTSLARLAKGFFFASGAILAVKVFTDLL